MFQSFETRLDQISSCLPAMKAQTLVALALTANLAIAPAASPAIGVAVAQGAFDIDAAKVAGNGTLFDGSILETGKATSEFKLQSGVHMMLDAGTRSKVYRDYMLLEKGASQMSGANYRISARSLQIEGESAKVSMDGNRVLVAALNSPVRVTNSSGMTLANVAAGRAVELEPASTPGANSLTGKLEKQAGRYFLTDETAGVTVEVRGSGLDRNAGKIVEVTGNTEKSAKVVAPASQVLYATNIRNSYTDSEEGGGSGAGAGNTNSNPTKVTGKRSRTKAMLAGVIISGAGAGTAVGLTRKNNKKKNISQ